MTSIRDLIERLEELAEKQGMAALVYIGVKESNEMISLGVVDIPSGGDHVLIGLGEEGRDLTSSERTMLYGGKE